MQNYEREIRDLHQFFQDYFLGLIQKTDITRFATCLADGFTIVFSNGNHLSRTAIIDAVRDGYGQHNNCHIWIENVQLRQHIHEVLIVTYEEWQTLNDVTTKRTSTVTFLEDSSKPNDLAWLHVHESGLKEVE
ncbi:MAG: hypothetical protein AAF846_24275 [Chloroflexota bacterium]